ncbi:major facilitator superfamily domain-containing protein [Syncephalastrum racemosum]|uniref:Major facilitator superfamily domain-containing protein n=1 Tax=Syncephalastrum racemosum TaxID=13706 RepID=A0A1X2HF56_SYNRA|nr:major facilitator superfamily domain-containing protein [Syncephalastrum racemosum]
MVSKMVGPKIWIPAIMITWGVIMAAMSATNNGPGLMAARFFLGVAESGLYPGLLLYLSMWYTKQEQAKRIAWFFCSSTLAGAFGGVLAYGIMRMEGVRGLHGWQWIFIIEAIPTIILAFVTYFVLPDYPEKTPVLNDREKAIITRRLREDAGVASQKHFSWKQFFDTFLDWKTWYFAVMYLCGSITVYSLSMFMPSIVKGMGYSSLNAQAMSAPPYAFACVFCVLLAYSADYFMERGVHLAGTSFLAMIGYILLITLKDSGNVALFIAAIITTMGAFSAAPPVASWFSNNFGGHTKKAIAIAIIISAGSIGGAIAGQVYRADDAPHYHPDFRYVL